MTTLAFEREAVSFPEDAAPDPVGHVTPDHTASDDGKNPWDRPKTAGRKPLFGTREKKTPSEEKSTPRMPNGGLKDPLTEMYVLVGAFLSPFDPICGGAIVQQAPAAAAALEKLAKENPAVRRALVNLVKGSAYGAVVTAHIPIVMAVFSHHAAPRIMEKKTRPEPQVHPDYDETAPIAQDITPGSPFDGYAGE